MPSKLASLETGQKFGPYEIMLSHEDAARYAAAVGGADSPGYGGALPPLAVIAAGLSRLIADLGLGAGAVHAGQEVEFWRSVRPGEKLTAVAELRGNSLRRDARFATVATEFKDEGGEVVATASSTVIVPA
jgi:acyl dehydratase